MNKQIVAYIVVITDVISMLIVFFVLQLVVIMQIDYSQ